MPATSVSGRPSITRTGAWPSGFSARNCGVRFSFLRNDTLTESNGQPISCSAICGAMELAPGAK
jgi:hypothetical protein